MYFFRREVLRLSLIGYDEYIKREVEKLKNLGIDLGDVSKSVFKNKNIRNYKNGCTTGISIALSEQKRNAEKETSGLKEIMVINDKEVSLYFNKAYLSQRTVKSRSRITDNRGYDDGVNAGKRINYSKGVSGNNSNQKMIGNG